MPGLYTGATGLWGGFTGLLYGTSALSTPPGLLADAAWSPAQLFTQGEQGAWYDPSDFSTMFQDSAGTTPVTAVQQPVGLILDKSRGLAIGGELVSNPGNPFVSTAGYSAGGLATISIDAGRLRVSQTVGFTDGVLCALPNNAFSTSTVISFTVDLGSSTLVQVQAGNGNFGNGNVIIVNITASGTYNITTTTLTSGASGLTFKAGSASNFFLSSVSVKQRPGNHASQTTSTSRPTLSARVNLLTYSEQFDNAAWTKSNASIGQNAATAPDGTVTADSITASTTGAQVYQVVTLSDSVSYTASIAVKKGLGSDWCYLMARNKAGTMRYIWFNVAAGTLGSTSGSPTAFSATDLGNGWYRLSITFDSGTGATSPYIYVSSATANSVGNPAASDVLYVWGADLRPANQVSAGMPNYQRIAAATDYDTNGFPYYLSCDGGDSLSTATINPGSVDKAQVFAGVRKLTDSAPSIISEFSANSSTGNNGSLGLGAASSSTTNYFVQLFGTGLGYYLPSQYTAPITNVISALFDIGAASLDAEITPRVNGIVSAQGGSGTVGTGNFGSYPFYIGARGGSSLYFTGNIYGLIIRFSSTNLPNSTVLQVEDWMDVKTFGKNMAVVYSDELTTALGELITAADGDQIYMTVAYV